MADSQVELAAAESRVVFGGLAGELVYEDADFADVDPQIQAMFGIDAPATS